ncbi:hypothetical protein [Pseudomonas sp. 5P_3.1_Bac2]|uniref:hypothetical protein n=1 Tax=Pseudomonas sp. 5P_3.1_Bac2 TaxID=2971617 RepID=UPI0021CA68A0|nr:hypothetical protein [Pseudomonas sp. 5P_3.1_Bac2]MCU1716193.1 hypothetical protein [Pseudomonas sp. 5P_3.1_Bac2]
MRFLLILWLMFALPVQAVLALESGHCPSEGAAVQHSHQDALAQQHGAASAAQHCVSQGPAKAQLNHCGFCVLCPAFGGMPASTGRLGAGFKAPQLAALAQAHSNRHAEVPDKPPKSSLLG